MAYSTAPVGPESDGNFIKRSKHGGVSLRLTKQADGVPLPLYSQGISVEGTVDLSDSKAESLQSVEVTVSVGIFILLTHALIPPVTD